MEKVVVTEILIENKVNPKNLVLLSNGMAMAALRPVNVGDEVAEEVWMEWGVKWPLPESRGESLSWHDKRDRDWSRHMC